MGTNKIKNAFQYVASVNIKKQQQYFAKIVIVLYLQELVLLLIFKFLSLYLFLI